ncbi:MAG: nucleotidyltransferase family protein [bacterium]
MKKGNLFSLDSREYRFLAVCTRPFPLKADQLSLTRSSRFSWKRLLDLASSCQVETLLYYQIRQRKISAPKAVMDALKERYHMVSGIQSGYFKILSRIFTDFNREGIGLVVLKGAAISRQLYPETACRSFGDIDLLIREKDLETGGKILDNTLKLALGRPDKGLLRKCIFHKLYTYPHGSQSHLKFELHWALFSRDSLIDYPVERLWKDPEELEITPAVKGRSLSLTNQFLHLCWHLNAHSFTSLRDFWDLDRLVTNRKPDWEEISELAGQYRLHNRIYHSLRLLQQMLGTELNGRLDLFRPSGKRWFPGEVEQDGLLNRACERQKDMRTVVELVLKDTWRSRISFLRLLAFPGACWFTIFPGEKPWKTQFLRHFLRGIRLYFFLARFFLSGSIRKLRR